MARKNVLVELRQSPELTAALFAADLRAPSFAAAPIPPASLPGLTLDPSFPAIALPISTAAPLPGAAATLETSAAGLQMPGLEIASTFVRGTIDEAELEPTRFEAGPVGDIVGIFADPIIEPCITCVDSPALGGTAEVAQRLAVPRLAQAGMTGRGVLLAIVDTGINLDYLRSRGLNPRFSAERSWAPVQPAGLPPLIPGQLPVSHGTMCAYDALIAAPQATLVDIAVLRSRRTGASAMDGLLSDAVLAYSFLLRTMREIQRPGDYRSLVVSNSWGMFQQSWDLPVGHPGNYSDNPRHPFNLIVSTLERAGADILFAAGNCGRECRDSRCGPEEDAGIFGANSHPAILSVAGVDIRGSRVGYSTRGPGHLYDQKPDICGFTHFDGSGVYPADGGTSAATPVVAGVIAAFRSRFPTDANRTPAALRDLVRGTAEKPGGGDFDYDTGFGVIGGSRLAQSTLPLAPPEGGPAGAGQEQDFPKQEGTRLERENSMIGVSDDEFLRALQQYGYAVRGGAAASMGAAAGCGCGPELSQQTMFGREDTMSDTSDQEFLRALQQFGFQGGGELGGAMGQGGFGGEFGGAMGQGGSGSGFGGAMAQGGFGGGFGQEESGGSEEQEFLRALQQFGFQGGGAMGQGGFGGGFGGAMAVGGGFGVDVAAAPSLQQLCRVWSTVRPILSRVLSILRAIPGVGSALAAALTTLGTILDGLCRGSGTATQLCQRWRGGLRVILVRIAGTLSRIPFVGAALAQAIRTLAGAIDAVCAAVG